MPNIDYIKANYQVREQSLKHKTILVTGANRGLGKEIALALAGAGAQVLLLGRDIKGLQEVYDLIENMHNAPSPVIIPCDLSHAGIDDYHKIAGGIGEQFSNLDGLIHNAAQLGTLTPIEQYDVDMWFKVMQINLHAPFLLTKTCLPLLKESAHAKILFMSSGVVESMPAYWGAYAVSKHALEGFAEVLANEHKQFGLQVNTVHPGVLRTEMRRAAFPLENPKKLATAQSVSRVFAHLMSDDYQGHGMQVHIV